MSIGYACLTVGVIGTKLRSCQIKNASNDILYDMIGSNLNALDRMLDYNIENKIKLFRISSDIIPFGSHPVNKLKWWEEFGEVLRGIGHKARSNDIRLSMHPGQYTVLNSPDEGVVARAIEDLSYHTRFMDALGLSKKHKIILHIGGIYGDKNQAVKRFMKNYRSLDDNIKDRLVIENDDKLYTINDVLSIGLAEGIPVVFDNLHNKVNPYDSQSDLDWISACGKTWRIEDGSQKIHYSQQDASKKPGSHSATINVDEFKEFYSSIGDKDLDIMLEVKDKNLSAIKCINATSSYGIKELEKEWSRYKYLVLEYSPRVYNEIRQLLKDKTSYPALEFYRLIDQGLMAGIEAGNAVNAGQHVWGYFKDSSDDKTKLKFEKAVEKVSRGESTSPMKRILWNLAMEKEEGYLLKSLYFKEFM